MTKLIVTPINLEAPGSWRQRRRFLLLGTRIEEQRTKNDTGGWMQTQLEMENLITPQLRTDDGTPVDDALDQLSARQFDELIATLAFQESVGEASAAPSEKPTEDAATAHSPSGK